MLTALQKRGQTTRRTFCVSALAAMGATRAVLAQAAENIHFNVAEYDRTRILAAAAAALKSPSQSITSIASPHADLGRNLFVSEDTEWWPAQGGGNERRPGYVNPAAFSAHRDALVAMNGHVAASVAAWRLTGERQYAENAMRLLRVWFLDSDTAMQPNLDHAACAPGSPAGTPRGVEHVVALAETARCLSFLCAYNGVATEEEAAALRRWFSAFASWLNESKSGFIAREANDRLAICWTSVAAACALFVRDETLLLQCSHRFRDKLLRLMTLNGEFNTELHRPDAYAASIFTLDCLAVACETLSSPMDRLWDFQLADGRGMRSAVAFLYPFLEDRAAWRYPADREHFNSLPVRQPSLLFAGRAYSRPEYIALWKRLPPEPPSQQMLRYFPVRQPALWTVRAPA